MKKDYFFVVSLTLLLLSVIAFSDNLIWDIGQESNSDPKFLIHGLLCFAWFVIFVVQANFIRKGDVRSHRKWGIAGMLTAVGVFVSMVYIFIVIYQGWEAMPFWIKANRYLMLSFAILVGLGFGSRKNPVRHKRFLYLATLYMLEPVLGRIGGHMGLMDWQFDVFEALIWNVLFVSLFVYDWKTLGKIHPISWIGVVWFYIVWILAILF
ncbi:MAG: hypothetical protein ACK4SF_15860 [Algoriphagus aquaeductus]|uniref:hypothetical protein n=1 Tax=Algoriphagus aquaeductus TaxID=475299 RepID=UPI00391DFF19